jgi:hypothetical protein
MKIRAIVEFVIDDEDDVKVEKLIGELVKVKSGEYDNAYMGDIISAEEILEVETE